ncbi:MAG: hypothetical protein QOE84_3350 [Actinomycetota bacterium]|jgi:hypothetical protein|nr:hypothetical protein [Actinomycetota bacterium]
MGKPMERDLTVPERLQLEQAYARYQSIMDRAPGTLDVTDATLQEVAGARLALCQALISTGWEPPAIVEAQMARDEYRLARTIELDPSEPVVGAAELG